MLAETSRVGDGVHASIQATVVIEFVIAQSSANCLDVFCDVAGPVSAVIVAQLRGALGSPLVKTPHVAVLEICTHRDTDGAGEPSAPVVNQQQVVRIQIACESA